MVYRGKPSAGCENCRKAKKRCGLEQPACARCVKLRKICSGYRDISQLQIQDESESVKIKANRQKVRTPASASESFTPPPATKLEYGTATPGIAAYTPHSEVSLTNDDTVEVSGEENKALTNLRTLPSDDLESVDLILSPGFGMPYTLKLPVHDIATTYFFNQFTSFNGHWTFLREQAMRSQIDPLIGIAIRACGMAALDNIQGALTGRQYSRNLYAEALGLLNAALRDSKRCKTDDSLMAVSMLGYYENLICESQESIQSWKAHINGATQLLKIRGKSQFKTQMGRILFRETRASILIHCLWDNLEPPPFLVAWEDELEQGDKSYIKPADEMTLLCFEFAALRAKIQKQTIGDTEALKASTQLEMKMVQWSIDTMTVETWKYHDLEVPDSPHVWNGVVHAYAPNSHPVASVWNTYRSMRVLLTRTQELLLRRFDLPTKQKEAQAAYFRSVRRQMTDEICAGIPTQLGHAAPATSSPCILISAYSSIWPLFFAGACALERVSPNVCDDLLDGNSTQNTSEAAAQARWTIGRMEYISKHVGLRWADGVAATLKGEFGMQEVARIEDPHTPPWIRKVERSGRAQRVLLPGQPSPHTTDQPGETHVSDGNNRFPSEPRMIQTQ